MPADIRSVWQTKEAAKVKDTWERTLGTTWSAAELIRTAVVGCSVEGCVTCQSTDDAQIDTLHNLRTGLVWPHQAQPARKAGLHALASVSFDRKDYWPLSRICGRSH